MTKNLTEDILKLIQNKSIDSILSALDFQDDFLEDIKVLNEDLNDVELSKIRFCMKYLIRLGGGSNDLPKEVTEASIANAQIIFDTLIQINLAEIDTSPSIKVSLDTLITNCKYRTINKKKNIRYELKNQITHEQKEILHRGYQIALTLLDKGLDELNSEEKFVLAYLFSSYSDYTKLLHSICDSPDTVLYINVQHAPSFLKIIDNVLQKYKKNDKTWNQDHGLHAIIMMALEFILMVIYEPYDYTKYYLDKVGSRPPVNIKPYLFL